MYNKQAIKQFAQEVLRQSIAFTTSIPFTHPMTVIASHTMTGNITLTPNATGAVDGYGAKVSIVANGTNTVDVSAFKQINGSKPFINTNGVINTFLFINDNGIYRYAIMQDVADVLIPLSAPVASAGAAGSTSLILNWTNVANESSYLVELATNAGFTTGYQSASKAANILTHTFTGLGLSTQYYMRVKAIGDTVSFSDSPASNVITLSTSGTETLVHSHVFNQTNGWGSWLDFAQNSGVNQFIDHNAVNKAVSYTQAVNDTARVYLNDPTFYNIGDTLKIKVFGAVQTGNGGIVEVSGLSGYGITLDGDFEVIIDTTGAAARHIYIGAIVHSAVLYWEKVEIYKL